MTLVAVIKLSDAAAIGAVLAGVGACVFGIVQAWIAITAERKRTQPIVIAEGDPEEHKVGDDKWLRTIRVRNEGSGPAFNVRFGVRPGRRQSYAYHSGDADPPGGSVIRVLRPGETWPREAKAACPVLLIRADDHAAPVEDRTLAYWCRYDNAVGNTWETHNPADHSSKLVIRRVRWRRRASREIGREGSWRQGSFREVGQAIAEEATRQQELVSQLAEERARENRIVYERANKELRERRGDPIVVPWLSEGAVTMDVLRTGERLDKLVRALADHVSEAYQVFGPTPQGQVLVWDTRDPRVDAAPHVLAVLDEVEPQWREYLVVRKSAPQPDPVAERQLGPGGPGDGVDPLVG